MLTASDVRRSGGQQMMHPILIDLYAQERHAEMLRTAERWRAARQRRDELLRERAAVDLAPPRSGRLRRRLGWTLVTIGLRLAVEAPAPRSR
jgi:hypothetical protein